MFSRVPCLDAISRVPGLFPCPFKQVSGMPDLDIEGTGSAPETDGQLIQDKDRLTECLIFMELPINVGET